MKNKARNIIKYHEATKHHFNRYARSSGYLDWKNQPYPFRFYDGCKKIPLPLLKTDPDGSHIVLYKRADKPAPFEIETISGMMELSMGLSAWKEAGGGRWALRMNPSSGNLHPTESYLILPPLKKTDPGVFHYSPLNHELEQRASISQSLWKKVKSCFGTDIFMVGLSSVFWRESWKYGERAFRYCNLDAGHALCAISFAAALFGWKATGLTELSDKDVETLLGFDKTSWKEPEEEYPHILCLIHQPGTDIKSSFPDHIIKEFSLLEFSGTPNRLSPNPVSWDIIYMAAGYTEKPKTRKNVYKGADLFTGEEKSIKGSEIIRKRRSGAAYSPQKSIGVKEFFAILNKTLAHKNFAPFDILSQPPLINLMIFVHRVEGLKKGLYFFIRNPHEKKNIQKASKSDFLWEAIDKDLPLFALEYGDFRDMAMELSCHQAICGDGFFSLGMIAKFREILDKAPYMYRYLMWEAGITGQVLYLEAEARNARGTGIGCFFDDPVHELMGFKDNKYQSLYHFTIGYPIEDKRITTYPPYFHQDHHRNHL